MTTDSTPTEYTPEVTAAAKALFDSETADAGELLYTLLAPIDVDAAVAQRDEFLAQGWDDVDQIVRDTYLEQVFRFGPTGNPTND